MGSIPDSWFLESEGVTPMLYYISRRSPVLNFLKCEIEPAKMVVNAVSIIVGAPHPLEWAFLLYGTLKRELFWSLVHLARIDKLPVPHLGTGVLFEGFSPEALGPGAWGQACCHPL